MYVLFPEYTNIKTAVLLVVWTCAFLTRLNVFVLFLKKGILLMPSFTFVTVSNLANLLFITNEGPKPSNLLLICPKSEKWLRTF